MSCFHQTAWDWLYNRLVRELPIEEDELLRRLIGDFELPGPKTCPNCLTIESDSMWVATGMCSKPWPIPLTPTMLSRTSMPTLFSGAFSNEYWASKIPRSSQLNFVGGDRSVDYLVSRVDSGEFAFAVIMAPVAMEQIIEVCEQDRFMPPKSTWFEPKIRIGLCISLF